MKIPLRNVFFLKASQGCFWHVDQSYQYFDLPDARSVINSDDREVPHIDFKRLTLCFGELSLRLTSPIDMCQRETLCLPPAT